MGSVLQLKGSGASDQQINTFTGALNKLTGYKLTRLLSGGEEVFVDAQPNISSRLF